MGRPAGAQPAALPAGSEPGRRAGGPGDCGGGGGGGAG